MFFQNAFDSSLSGSMLFADYVSWSIKGNVNRNDQSVNWVNGPFNLTGNNVLTINFSILTGDTPQAAKYYSAINVTLPNSASVTSETIVNALNADTQFKSWFEAFNYDNYRRIEIKSKAGRLGLRYYFSNTSAETILRFNQKAPVKELPSFFMRHTIVEAPNYPDSLGQLIYLDPNNSVDAQIIRNAGLDPTNEQTDWELLAGRTEEFKFELNTYDGSGRVTQTIEFYAGASVGDASRKTVYTYTGANTLPTKVFQMPFVLDYATVSQMIPLP